MSNQQIQPYQGAIEAARDQFLELAAKSELDWEAEAMFATQAMTQNGFLAKVANQNPTSAQMAVINVAAVGLTLNPAQGLAFLVPRDGQVLLDISYRGLIRIAMDEGAIRAAKAELVYEQDRFVYKGPFEVPEHHCNPFSDQRGAMVGAYCSARLPDGTWLTETMSMADIEAVRATSEAYAKKGKGPWVTFFGEMVKKSIAKRASKWWQSANHERLSEAVRLLNEDNGEGFAPGQSSAAQPAAGGNADQGRVYEHDADMADPEQASDFCKQKTARVIARATASGEWAAAEEYIGERFQSHDLAYAQRELAQARAETPATAEQ